MFWLRSKLTKASWWASLFLVSGVMLLTVAAVLGNERGYERTELLAGKTIVVDPGHGGVDGGAVSSLGYFEKEITLQIGKKLADRIGATGAKAVLTREDDIDYYTRGKGGKRSDLDKRLNITTENEGQMLISVHANAIKGRRWAGAQVFYHPNSAEGKILAHSIQQHLANFPPGNKRKEKPDDFYILRQCVLPAVIVEVGFLSNEEEAARLKNEGYQDRLAEGIFRGIVHYMAVKSGEQQ
jgi:N-acetylmuramoyl-L-alanine amidase